MSASPASASRSSSDREPLEAYAGETRQPPHFLLDLARVRPRHRRIGERGLPGRRSCEMRRAAPPCGSAVRSRSPRGAVALAALAAGGGRRRRPAARICRQRPNAIPVDVELVLAVDVSYSMDPGRAGAAARRLSSWRSPRANSCRRAASEGMHGNIAITYFEWAGASDQKIVHAVAADRRAGSGRRGRRRDRARALSARLAHLDFRRAAVRRAAVREQRLSRHCAASSTSPATAPTTRARW